MNTARPRSMRSDIGLDHVVGWWMVSFVGSAFLAFGLSGDRPFSELAVWAIFAAQIPLWVAYGLGPVASCRVTREEARDFLGLSIEGRDVLIGGMIGVLVQFPLIPLVYWPILQFVDEDPGQAAEDLIDRATTFGDDVLLFVMIVVLAPLVEEIFYRGLFLQVLRKRYSDVVAVVVTAALFAVLHFQPLQAPGLFLFGLVAGALRVRYGRLGPCWAMHAAFNGLTFALIV